jgi:hypothetical protein
LGFIDTAMCTPAVFPTYFIIPSEFGISFDNFRRIRLCRLLWRDVREVQANGRTEVGYIANATAMNAIAAGKVH